MPNKIINTLIADLTDARARTVELINGLDARQIIGPKLATVNPLLWEIGHVAYFYEFWILRHLDGADSFLANADKLYDSINIAHNDRWDLPLLSLEQTQHYMQQVMDAVIQRLKNNRVTEKDIYLTRYALFHEDMHTEAYTYSRRTLNYPVPKFSHSIRNETVKNTNSFNLKTIQGNVQGDAHINGGEYLLGAPQDIEFCFDNEKWQHPITVKPFSIARIATTYQQFAEFVNDNGYTNQKFWDAEGWQWRTENNIEHPNGWKKTDNHQWKIKHFDQWLDLPQQAAVIHINWYEANAWCRWAGRRLPSEAEWELAASGTPENINAKRHYPWGKQPPTAELANINGRHLGTINASALPKSDSAFGCRQMIGNSWEWVADTFEPYPEFKADMYADYSQPLFGQTKVLRGGAWPTRGRMIRNTWRTYYGPDRNDVFAGFRSCAL